MRLKEIVESTRDYTFHSHTQFCDGKASMAEMAKAAYSGGMKHYAFTPHCPTTVASPCNMDYRAVKAFLAECDRLKKEYAGRMTIYSGMEIDFISPTLGPQSYYYQQLPLDIRIGSVHFVTTQRGEPVDCDGSPERFARYLNERFGGDLRYVVEKYYEQISLMLTFGNFDILGHFDKIAGNASSIDPAVEERDWYENIMRYLIPQIAESGVAVEINTKAYNKNGRFYPSKRWWRELADAGVTFVVNSDAHHPDLVNAGRGEAFAALDLLNI